MTHAYLVILLKCCTYIVNTAVPKVSLSCPRYGFTHLIRWVSRGADTYLICWIWYRPWCVWFTKNALSLSLAVWTYSVSADFVFGATATPELIYIKMNTVEKLGRCIFLSFISNEIKSSLNVALAASFHKRHKVPLAYLWGSQKQHSQIQICVVD